MSEYEFLTPEDFKTAESNGINYINAYQRFYVRGWSKERAINTPLLKPQLWTEWKEIATAHGVTQDTFYARVRKGLSFEDAATEPVIPHTERWRNPKARVHSKIVEQAAKNGISERTLKQRIYVYKWEVERAMTTPVDKSKGNKKGKKINETVST